MRFNRLTTNQSHAENIAKGTSRTPHNAHENVSVPRAPMATICRRAMLGSKARMVDFDDGEGALASEFIKTLAA